ncbi:4Fe-4S ferredoxin iron-sulfur binding domain- containing protein [Acidimicrobium ferrooxidans DSM 10331]|uniref:4Fe-4S ferredoxin iron-sulfur binding domain-containing protein n=1 Tax=Acidimicrobium ferrooxidans (strain DSM 10331 / JCM 15462 / NBRC 103882 / ICP) TaxID=525909 RepID=C7M088_ACIFD|nr:cytochrome c oxidase assembly protein [Acidimicrobium ferrooxidans]ACU54396.1 4Fe-4S ferredoxin iron-sulfur binding domain- containing protein [Acidimicrobium ferrooxidans DSM 10331]
MGIVGMSMAIQPAHGLVAYVLENWSVDWWGLIIFGLPIALYWRGHLIVMRTLDDPELRRGYERRALLMLGGMAALAIGLFSPIAAWSMVYQWVHMIWHLDLMILAPPLIVRADPWGEIVAGVPEGPREAVRRLWGRLGAHAPIARVWGVVSSPWSAVVAFDAAMWIWHLPGPFDWAMASGGRMELMMFSFFTSGIWMWYVAVDPNPRRQHESPIVRFAHMVIVSMSCMILAIVLGLSTQPWYSAYEQWMGTLRTLSLEADQQIAAGILWVFGAVPWFIAGVVTLRDFLTAEQDGVIDALGTFRAFTLRKVRTTGRRPAVRSSDSSAR